MAGKYTTALNNYLSTKEKQNKSTNENKLAANTKTANNYKARLEAGGVDVKDATDSRNGLEKLLNLKEGQNTLFDIFELLNRPQQALFTGVKNVQEGKDFKEGLKSGISGTEETQFKDILKNFGMEDREGKLDLVDVAGFAGDVFLDPMNFGIIPGIKAGGKLASVDDLIGMGIKKGIKGTASLANKGIEAGLGALDATKGVTNNLGDAVKIGYANNASDTAANLQKYVRNASEVSGNLPTGRLEKYKQIKDELRNAFKVSDASKKAIISERLADADLYEFEKKSGIDISDVQKDIKNFAEKSGKSADEIGEDLMLLGESKASRSKKLSDIFKTIKNKGNVPYDETIANNLIDEVKKVIPSDISNSLDLSITKGKKGQMLLGGGWNDKVLKANNIDLSDFNKALEGMDTTLKSTYTPERLKKIEELNNLYSIDDDFKKLTDKIVGTDTQEGIINRINKYADTTMGTNLTEKYAKENLGYFPHVEINKNNLDDFFNIPEGTTKGSSSILNERKLEGSVAEINDAFSENLRQRYDTLSQKGKDFVDKNSKLFEENVIKAIDNRYFDQLPSTLKQNKMVNDVLLEQTFGDAKKISDLQSQIHKLSISGDKEGLAKISNEYNNLIKDSNIKFLTKYDNSVPKGYSVIDNTRLNEITGKLDKISSQLGNNSELKKLATSLKKGKGNVAINNDVLRMLEVSTNNKQLGAIGRFYNDVMLNNFKKWKTMSPTFLANNLVGNSSNLYLSGIDLTDQARLGTKAADIITNGEKYYNMKLAGEVLDDVSNEVADLWDMFNKSGFGGKNTLSALNVQDMPENLQKYFKNNQVPKGVEWIKDGLPYLNNKANIAMDNSARLTIMLKTLDDPNYIKSLGIDTTDTIDGIRQAISKVMFDPNMMTDFERNTMKKIVPFYTYAKNNLMYHADNLGRNMGRYERTISAIQTLQKDATNGNEKDMADYLKNSLYIPIPGMKKDGSYTVLRTQLPFGQITDLLSDPLQTGISMLTPMIKAPMETLLNKNSFTGNDIEKYTGEKSKNIPFLTKKQENLLGSFTGLDVPLKNINRIVEGVSGSDNLGQGILGGLSNTITMKQNVNTDKLYRTYDDINELQDLMKQYEAKGYEFSTINELKQANKNGTVSNIQAILNKYNIQ